jgi:hypothetical protein
VSYTINPRGPTNHNQKTAYIAHFVESARQGLSAADFWDETFDLGAYLDEIQAETSTADALNCEIHSAGGAMFWFTIMTTVGYGNTAPTTEKGRVLVHTLGLVSIILFGSCHSTACH